MKLSPRALCCALLTSTLCLAAHAAAPAKAARAAPALTTAQIETIVHDYLLKNPGILREASDLLQREDMRRAQAASTTTIEALGKELWSAAESPVVGNPQGDVTIVEFFDYHCGYCKKVAPAVKELLAGDPNIRLVYKELPILGPDSITAARAALAANRQGKYQPFHDALFAAPSLAEPDLLALAALQGLDIERLRADMASADIAQELERNVNMSTPLGINGTPGFVIGNSVAPGALDLDGLRQMVEQARKAQRQTSAAR